VDDYSQQISLRVDGDVPLASLDLLTCVVAARPPLPVVLADCESMIATVGVMFRPLERRPCSRNTRATRSQVPSSR
jgi:hypothetical protein